MLLYPHLFCQGLFTNFLAFNFAPFRADIFRSQNELSIDGVDIVVYDVTKLRNRFLTFRYHTVFTLMCIEEL